MSYQEKKVSYQNEVNLLDDSQKVLYEYCKITRNMMQGLLNAKVKNAQCEIVPSVDMGFPNNVMRLAGGFATGLCINWDCRVPFIPIDTTMNVCSSSICKLNTEDIEKLKELFSQKRIEDITREMQNLGMLFNFKSGNHFVMIAENRKKELFLVLHSSDNFFKNKIEGLYPSKQVWYNKDIQIYVDHTKERVLRYLWGETAKKFSEIVQGHSFDNVRIHKEFSKRLFKMYVNEREIRTYHHYGMPTDHTMILGTYLLDINDIVPIFSTRGYPICLFQPNSKTQSIIINGKRKYVVPHGWGQEIRKIRGIEVDWEKSRLLIKREDDEMSYEISSEARISPEVVTVRNLEIEKVGFYTDDFEKNYLDSWKGLLKGNIKDILYPIAIYSKECEEIEYYV